MLKTEIGTDLKGARWVKHHFKDMAAGCIQSKDPFLISIHRTAKTRMVLTTVLTPALSSKEREKAEVQRRLKMLCRTGNKVFSFKAISAM